MRRWVIFHPHRHLTELQVPWLPVGIGYPRCENNRLKGFLTLPLELMVASILGIRPSVSQRRPNHLPPHCLISGALAARTRGGVHGF